MPYHPFSCTSRSDILLDGHNTTRKLTCNTFTNNEFSKRLSNSTKCLNNVLYRGRIQLRILLYFKLWSPFSCLHSRIVPQPFLDFYECDLFKDDSYFILRFCQMFPLSTRRLCIFIQQECLRRSDAVFSLHPMVCDLTCPLTMQFLLITSLDSVYQASLQQQYSIFPLILINESFVGRY